MVKNNSRFIIIEKIKGVIALHYKKILFGILLLVFCFLPVIFDMISNELSYALFEEDMLNIGEKAFCTSVTGEINETKNVIQTFRSQMASVSSIELKAYIYDADSEGGLTIKLVDDSTGAVVEEWNVDASDLGSDASFSLKCKRPMAHMNMKGKEYRLKIESKGTHKRSGIGLYELATDSYTDGGLIENGRDNGHDLLMKISGYNGIVNMERVRVWLGIYKAAVIAGLLYWGMTLEARKQRNHDN